MEHQTCWCSASDGFGPIQLHGTSGGLTEFSRSPNTPVVWPKNLRLESHPKRSMYGLFTYIWLSCMMANVGKIDHTLSAWEYKF